jgi:hypothetical protein
MKKLFNLCLCISVLFLLPAFSAPANGKAKPKADVTEKKISFDTGKKDKKGKSVRREFPVMFSIADRARKHKDKKAGKK